MISNGIEINTELKADAVIIGSGSGLLAAVAAVESGAGKVIVLEKQNRTGGNTILARDIFACESPLQERSNIISTKDENFKLAMKWAHWDGIKPRIIRRYINKSGDTIRWLEEKGVKFREITPYQLPTTHNAEHFNKSVFDVLIKECENLGIEIYTGTRVTKILRDDSGATAGVKAVDTEGHEINVHAHSVIIASGGIQGNIDLVRRFCPDYYEGMELGDFPAHSGDGLLMAEEIGAGIADRITIGHLGPALETGYLGGLSWLIYEPYPIWVNKKGLRFVDEAWPGHWETGNAVMNQPGRKSFVIFDRKLQQHAIERMGDSFEKEVSKLVNLGQMKISDSIDEIAEWIGADQATLRNTMKEYNDDCITGNDRHFAKQQEAMEALVTPPYHVIRCGVHIGETTGGIHINEDMQVLDREGLPIPGLFAAGVITDGWSGQTYCNEMLGSCASYAMNTGRIAGESAAKYIEECYNKLTA